MLNQWVIFILLCLLVPYKESPFEMINPIFFTAPFFEPLDFYKIKSLCSDHQKTFYLRSEVFYISRMSIKPTRSMVVYTCNPNTKKVAADSKSGDNSEALSQEQTNVNKKPTTKEKEVGTK